MDYTPNINTQGMRQPMGPVDQPNWNGGPRLNHNPQVMNNRAVGQPNLSNAMANQQPIIPIRGRIVTSEQDIVPAEIPMDASNNVATSTLIKNCCGDYDRITVTNTGTADVTVAANSAFIVRRLA